MHINLHRLVWLLSSSFNTCSHFQQSPPTHPQPHYLPHINTTNTHSPAYLKHITHKRRKRRRKILIMGMVDKVVHGHGEGEGEGEEGGTMSVVATVETLLRVVPMALCVAAMVVMIKNAQSNDYGSISYADLGGFSYLVYANGICAGYSFLSAFYTTVNRTSKASTMSAAWTYFLFDQVMTYVVLAAGAVSTELVYLAYKGDTDISWSEACSVYSSFCSKATASVIITYVAMACYILLSLLSSYRLFTKYEGPIVSYSNRNIAVPANLADREC